MAVEEQLVGVPSTFSPNYAPEEMFLKLPGADPSFRVNERCAVDSMTAARLFDDRNAPGVLFAMVSGATF
jgi:hypothetical protein